MKTKKVMKDSFIPEPWPGVQFFETKSFPSMRRTSRTPSFEIDWTGISYSNESVTKNNKETSKPASVQQHTY
jgi:hypothetical protein